MKSLTLTRFDPEPPDDDWAKVHVGYDAVLDDGRTLHSVTTVYRSQAPSGARDEVLAVADADILPGLILQDRQQPHDVDALADAAVAARVAASEATARAAEDAVHAKRFEDIERYYYAEGAREA